MESRCSSWFTFVPCTYKQQQTINHHILHYFVEVYCVRNLKHLFKNWICDPFFFFIYKCTYNPDPVQLTQLNEVHESCPAGGTFLVGMPGLFISVLEGCWVGGGTHTWGPPFSFIPRGGCWFSNAAVGDLRSLCYAVLHRVAKADHNLQAHCFVKVDSPVQPGDVTNGLR